MFRRAIPREHGQAIVLMAVVLIALLAFAALAIDGGVTLSKRRITQNAADGSTLGGVQYIASADSPSESTLISRIHDMVESHGVPDTDGIPGNEVNDNVTIFYTDQDGNQLGGCSELPCGSIPLPTKGLDVIVRQDFPTFIAGVLGIDRANVAATANAVIRGGSDGGLGDLAMLALGDGCSIADKPIGGSGSDTEIIGASHSNSHIDISGQYNHFHGQVSYVGDWNDVHQTDPPEDRTTYEPALPITGTLVANPLEGLAVSDFAPGGSEVQGVPPAEYFDLSGIPEPIVVLQDLLQYNDITKELDPGVYYAGDKEINLGNSDVHGSVTLVSSNRIIINGSNLNLNAYIASGMLMFSDHQPSEPCKDHVIDLGGSSGGIDPVVDHSGTCPYTRNDPDTPCWTPSDHVLTGLIYAPRGKVQTSGSKITIIGGILAWSIKLNGSKELIVNNPHLFPPTAPIIELIK